MIVACPHLGFGRLAAAESRLADHGDYRTCGLGSGQPRCWLPMHYNDRRGRPEACMAHEKTIAVSRMRETRTSGLKGDLRKRSRRATAPEVYQ